VPRVSLEASVASPDLALADKVDFLSRATTYGLSDGEKVDIRETHMSWVFLAGERVYKLKKPVRFPYLDFSTLARRETACRAEIRLNRRLAPSIYLDVIPLVLTQRGLALGGSGEIVDWLVVMRRLNEQWTLEHALTDSHVDSSQLDRLVTALVDFYRRAQPIFTTPAVQLAEWRRSLINNSRTLLDPRLGLPSPLVRRLDHIQSSFLTHCADLLVDRVRRRRIVDGHGDLRPEHIWLSDGIKIIDCLEFNAQLRAVDPFDELAYFSLECERLGAGWAGEYCRHRIVQGLHDDPPEALYRFYRCHRAQLRARLAIAHLLEPKPRTPEKWPRVSRAYLDIASHDASYLERFIRRRQDRSVIFHYSSAISLRQRVALRAKPEPSFERAPTPAETAAQHL
jgi:aminoglycoside phosphotransferase family enzyme